MTSQALSDGRSRTMARKRVALERDINLLILLTKTRAGAGDIVGQEQIVKRSFDAYQKACIEYGKASS